VLARLTRKPGFADRYALDVLRLKLVSGTAMKTEEHAWFQIFSEG
jgi:hypothetical protein